MANTSEPIPAGYSHTSTAETKAILCLRNLLDVSRVKTHISENDKTPNHDGFLEILDEDQIPIGKVTVQVKALPAGDTKFSCPCELPAYSRRISEPFLLFCVDVQNNCAFWKHIRWDMLEFKQDQKTFTIYFSEADTVDAQKDYLSQWLYICNDYVKRINEFCLLKEESEHVGSINGLSSEQIQEFQDMIDFINLQFESKWTVIKDRYFSLIWKIGVGVVSATADGVRYLIYQIPYGKSNLLIRKASEADFNYENIGKKRNILQATWYANHVWESRKAGLEFLKTYVYKALKTYNFKITGNLLATEIVTSFVNHYTDLLDIPESERCNVQELRNRILPRLTNPKYLNQHSVRIRILSEMECVTKNASVNMLYNPNMPWPDNKLSAFPLHSVFEALEYLNVQKIKYLENELPLRDMESECEHPIRNFSDTRELDRAAYIADNIVGAYVNFLEGNELTFLPSRYLNPKFSFIYTYSPRYNMEDGSNSRYVTSLTECCVLNYDGLLSRSKFIPTDIAGNDDFFMDNKIKIDGRLYSIQSWCGGNENLYSSMPLFSEIYFRLKRDIDEYFKQN